MAGINNRNITRKIHTDSKKRRFAMLFTVGDFGRYKRRGRKDTEKNTKKFASFASFASFALNAL